MTLVICKIDVTTIIYCTYKISGLGILDLIIQGTSHLRALCKSGFD